MERGMDEAAQQPSAEAPRDRSGNVRAHHHVEALGRKAPREVCRQAGAHRRDEQALHESRGDEQPDLVRHRADQAGHADQGCARQDDGTDRVAVGEHAEGEVGERDAEDHRRHRQRGNALAHPELGLQDRQHGLRDVDVGERRRDQPEDHRLQSRAARVQALWAFQAARTSVSRSGESPARGFLRRSSGSVFQKASVSRAVSSGERKRSPLRIALVQSI